MSSSKKAALLAGSATFDAVAQPMSARSRAFAALNGQAPHPAASEPTGTMRLRPNQLAHNPFNPREELKAITEMADSLVSRGVIQPLTVVTRAAFLAAHPGHETTLSEAEYVVVDGNRRLAGANLAGLDDLPVHVDDSLAADADTLLETALTAAVQHEDLDPLEEAKALDRLVVVHGSQRAVARALGKSGPWVTQRLALLKLTPELQQAVEDKHLPVEVARRVGQLPQQQQREAAEQALADRADSKARKTKAREEAKKPSPKGANAVSTQPDTARTSRGANGVSAPAAEQATPQADRSAPAAQRSREVESVAAVARDIKHRLTEAQIEELIELLMA